MSKTQEPRSRISRITRLITAAFGPHQADFPTVSAKDAKMYLTAPHKVLHTLSQVASTEFGAQPPCIYPYPRKWTSRVSTHILIGHAQIPNLQRKATADYLLVRTSHCRKLDTASAQLYCPGSAWSPHQRLASNTS